MIAGIFLLVSGVGAEEFSLKVKKATNLNVCDMKSNIAYMDNKLYYFSGRGLCEYSLEENKEIVLFGLEDEDKTGYVFREGRWLHLATLFSDKKNNRLIFDAMIWGGYGPDGEGPFLFEYNIKTKEINEIFEDEEVKYQMKGILNGNQKVLVTKLEYNPKSLRNRYNYKLYCS